MRICHQVGEKWHEIHPKRKVRKVRKVLSGPASPTSTTPGYPVPKRFASFQALDTENWIPLGRTTTFQIQDTPPYFTLGRKNKPRKLRNWYFTTENSPWPLKKDGWKTAFLFGRWLFRGYVKCWGGSFRRKKCSSVGGSASGVGLSESWGVMRSGRTPDPPMLVGSRQRLQMKNKTKQD